MGRENYFYDHRNPDEFYRHKLYNRKFNILFPKMMLDISQQPEISHASQWFIFANWCNVVGECRRWTLALSPDSSISSPSGRNVSASMQEEFSRHLHPWLKRLDFWFTRSQWSHISPHSCLLTITPVFTVPSRGTTLQHSTSGPPEGRLRPATPW